MKKLFLLFLLLLPLSVFAGWQVGPVTTELSGEYWVSGNEYGVSSQGQSGPFFGNLIGVNTWLANGPGDALAACLNLMVTNGQYYPYGTIGFSAGSIFTTNILGGALHIYPGDYYRPQGYIISNTWANSSFHIYGESEMNTWISGNSNVLGVGRMPRFCGRPEVRVPIG